MFRLVRLQGFEARRPASLSGGQQQRVALARALATNPALVLLDEPLSALDAKLRQELRSELKEILSAAGATTIVVTHDQEEAMSLAEHVIVMANGRILQQGPPSTIYRAPSSQEVAAFIGRSNWFDGALGGDLDGGLREFRCADGSFAVRRARTFGGRLRALRSGRSVSCWRGRTIRARGVNHLPGTVAEVLHLGAEIHVLVKLRSGRTLLVIQQDRAQALPESGSAAMLWFGPNDGGGGAGLIESGTPRHAKRGGGSAWALKDAQQALHAVDEARARSPGAGSAAAADRAGSGPSGAAAPRAAGRRPLQAARGARGQARPTCSRARR